MEMIIPDELAEYYSADREYIMEEISDWLSDETGFCHAGFELIDVEKCSLCEEIF